MEDFFFPSIGGMIQRIGWQNNVKTENPQCHGLLNNKNILIKINTDYLIIHKKSFMCKNQDVISDSKKLSPFFIKYIKGKFSQILKVIIFWKVKMF